MIKLTDNETEILKLLTAEQTLETETEVGEILVTPFNEVFGVFVREVDDDLRGIGEFRREALSADTPIELVGE